jgi:hypothetical protein
MARNSEKILVRQKVTLAESPKKIENAEKYMDVLPKYW